MVFQLTEFQMFGDFHLHFSHNLISWSSFEKALFYSLFLSDSDRVA